VLPGNRRAVGHRVEKRFAALGIRDVFQLLRQIEIIPAVTSLSLMVKPAGYADDEIVIQRRAL
jgi:hypothetical protein